MTSKIEPIPKDELRRMYWDNGMNTYKIAGLVGASQSTILKWMQLYNITRRTNSEAKFGYNIDIPSKESLHRMYLDENMSTYQIGELVSISASTICNLMKKHGISRRTLAEAQIFVDNNGKNSPHWKGGPKKYCYKFSTRFREAVRDRDNYTCQNCGYKQKLDRKKLAVHHIHYDAENCYPDVLSLCESCHNSSNYNRDAWETHYWCILRDRGLLEWEPPWAEERDENDT